MPQSDQPYEMLDLVNENDKVIGVVSREEVETKLLELDGMVRAVNCFMVNSAGKIWVPRRTSHKSIAPKGLDFSVGEHVKAGESYAQAIVRGFDEELRMSIDPLKLTYVGMVNLRRHNLLPYLETIFILHHDAVPNYNKNDFSSYEWLLPADFVSRIKNGEVAKRNLLPALEMYNHKIKYRSMSDEPNPTGE